METQAKQAKRVKSSKYPGIYWRGAGQDKVFYVIYRRPGENKTCEERLGKASEGWTEAKASRERAKRIEAPRRIRKTATLTELWTAYQEAHVDGRSIQTDSSRFTLHIAPVLGNRQISDLRTQDIVSLRRAIEANGLAPQTVKHVLSLVKRIVNYGLKMDLIDTPQGLQFPMPTFDNTRTEMMSPSQLEAYQRALDENPDQKSVSILRLALLTGLRRGALFGLQWQDVDLDRKLLTLRGESAKNGRTAIIPLSDAAAALLANLHSAPAASTSIYVFPGKDGRKRTTCQRIAARIRNEAGLPSSFRPMHGLRHEFASQLASSGEVSLFEIQKLLTHSAPTVTQRYAHLCDGALRRAANVASESLAPAQEHAQAQAEEG